jgi:hypothetical protein
MAYLFFFLQPRFFHFHLSWPLVPNPRFAFIWKKPRFLTPTDSYPLHLSADTTPLYAAYESGETYGTQAFKDRVYKYHCQLQIKQSGTWVVM